MYIKNHSEPSVHVEQLNRSRCNADSPITEVEKKQAAMAKPIITTKTSASNTLRKLFNNPKIPFSFALLLADALLVSLIIAYVPYTKIDWDAYMSQVSGFLGGERDYSKLEGDTGPLVYPAGFLYVYSAIQFVTGGQVLPAQILFGVLYIVNLSIVLLVYVKTDVCFHCLTKNGISVDYIQYSGAVSIKMNVLLYAPPLLLLMLKALNSFGVVLALAGAAVVQILLGMPFIISNPISYISRAFNLGRIFIHFWSVNFKFVPEPIFVSRMFAVSLLVTHLILLAAFANYKWCKHEGGIFTFLHSRIVQMKRNASVLSSFPLKQFPNGNAVIKLVKKEHIVTAMFVGNFIGIVCARSLHYQFYSWYFYTLPYLLWRTSFPTIIRLILFTGVEVCWNVFPTNSYSSITLLCLHLLILWGLWSAPPEYPYVDANSSTKNKAQ